MDLLFDGQSTNGNSSPVQVEGLTSISMYGTWGGATVKLQSSGRTDKVAADIPAASWVDIADASKTADAEFVIETGDVWLRSNMASAGTTAVTVTASSERRRSSI